MMTTLDYVHELLKDLETAEQLANHPELLLIIEKLGNLEDQANEAVPSLLSLFSQHYNVPVLRDALKITFKKLKVDYSSLESIEKLRIPTRLLLLFALIMLNGTIFAWGAILQFPFDYSPVNENGSLLMDLFSAEYVVISHGNYYWILSIFLLVAIFCLLYLGYLLYIIRSPSSFPLTPYWTSIGLIIPLFGLLWGLISMDQTFESWVIFSSITSFQRLLVVGFFSFFWFCLVNIQYSSLTNGFIHRTLNNPSTTHNPAPPTNET